MAKPHSLPSIIAPLVTNNPPPPPLLFPWEMNNNLSGGQMKHGLWLQGDRLSFLSFIFHLCLPSWHKWHIWNGNLGKVGWFSRASLLSFGVWRQWGWEWRGREIPEAAVCTGDEWRCIMTRKYPSPHTMGPYYIYHAPACPSTCDNWIQGHQVLKSLLYVNPPLSVRFSLQRVVLKAKS